jgi:CII-binding regulator of phage lambda lysogenization HflD
MNHKELTDALEVVHQELGESENLDAAEVEKLRATMSEIQAVLDQQGDRDESLSDRVSSSARRFEESHPVLTETLGRVADILQQMGI